MYDDASPVEEIEIKIEECRKGMDKIEFWVGERFLLLLIFFRWHFNIQQFDKSWDMLFVEGNRNN